MPLCYYGTMPPCHDFTIPSCIQDNNVGCCDIGGNGGVTEVGVDCGGWGDGSKPILQPAAPTAAKSVATNVLTKPEQRRNVDKTE